jgi:hypothetical protein
LVIVLSALWFTASDYLFGIFKLFFLHLMLVQFPTLKGPQYMINHCL